jgi:hypothetical protein
MQTALLQKIFGADSRWQGPCILILDADAAVQTLGADNIGPSAIKQYAPRLISGRVPADQACLTSDGAALLVLQQHKVPQGAGGGEVIRQTLLVLDPARLVAVEFADMALLGQFGVVAPPVRPSSHPGTYHRPGH